MKTAVRKLLSPALAAACLPALLLLSSAAGPVPASPRIWEPVNRDGAFISRYGCRFPLPEGYEGDSRFHETQKDIELVMLYPKGLKERAWTAFDKISPPAIAIEIVPLLARELAEPKYMEKMETGLASLMEANGWQAETGKIKGAALKGRLTRVKEPAHCRARLYGANRLYKFVSRDWEPALKKVVTGFREKAK